MAWLINRDALRTFCAVVGFAASIGLSLGHSQSSRSAAGPDWPAITHETRPWTRWWWMGSAVDRAGLSADLEALKQAGIGGVEITPIYGAGGSEAHFVQYLSDPWVALLEHALA